MPARDEPRTWFVAGNALPRLNIAHGAPVSGAFYAGLRKHDDVCLDDLALHLMPEHEISTLRMSLAMAGFRLSPHFEQVSVLSGAIRHHLKKAAGITHHDEVWLFAELRVRGAKKATESLLVPIRRMSEVISENPRAAYVRRSVPDLWSKQTHDVVGILGPHVRSSI